MPAPVLGPIGSLADHARLYAQVGLEVFPADPRSKAPLVERGFYDATTNLDQIDAWWGRWPLALIAHRVAADQLLLDIDPRHGGIEVWMALKAEIGQLPVTRIHRSGRGDLGMHFWWLRPGERISTRPLDQWAKERGLGQQLEARWTCGIDPLHNTCRYTILPPSPHPDSGQPYRWYEHRGFEIPPAPLPAYLADLLVVEEPTPIEWTPPADPDSDSIADWYSHTHGFTDVLCPHGWQIVAGDGNHDGSRWRHPDATSQVSATVRHGCLFVYSTSTCFEPTVPDEPRGYTPFKAWATVAYGGNQSEAARAARAIKDPVPADMTAWVTSANPTTNGSGATAPTPAGHTDSDPLQGDPDIQAVIAEADIEYDWLIEGLIERGDRIILTGPEGGGKTTLLRQVATLAASGIHPFTEAAIPPIKVLYVDCENSRRQTIRQFSPLIIQAGGELARDMLIPIIRPEGLDLLKTPDCAWLAQRIEANQPGLVIIGPLYKLALGDPISEEIARHVAFVLDTLRDHYGVAVLIEAHQPHKSNGHRPDRPYGASLWMRWPEFGLSISSNGFLNHWRGPRDERQWPNVLQRGGTWPWMPVTASQATYVAVVAACREAGEILSERALSRATNIPKSTVHDAIEMNRNHWKILNQELTK